MDPAFWSRSRQQPAGRGHHADPIPELWRRPESDPKRCSRTSRTCGPARTTALPQRRRASSRSPSRTRSPSDKPRRSPPTVAAALTVLAVFFYLTVRQPALAVVAVGPIVLVLICVLGTMALLGIPYSPHHVDHYRALDRYRGGLHHPCDPPLPARSLPACVTRRKRRSGRSPPPDRRCWARR